MAFWTMLAGLTLFWAGMWIFAFNTLFAKGAEYSPLHPEGWMYITLAGFILLIASTVIGVIQESIRLRRARNGQFD